MPSVTKIVGDGSQCHLALPTDYEPSYLLTFDVDGTLVHGTGQAAAASVHARAFGHALATLFNNGKAVTPVAEALPRRLYQGSTDGLILLRYAKATLRLAPAVVYKQLPALMECMYEYVSQHSDEDITEHMKVLPGVLDHLQTLASLSSTATNNVHCGLVTGNVEGIARRKMHATGIWQTGALSAACVTQKTWPGTEQIQFLGGFGSDYCSGNIDDLERNHLDRASQIEICAQRCQNLLQRNTKAQKALLTRVVHVGDAPADVLAAKAYRNQQVSKDDNMCVGMVAVATGSYPANELRKLAGEAIPGYWEPVILENGMADPKFLEACGIHVKTLR